MKSPGHVKILCLTFGESTILFSNMTLPFDIVSNMMQNFNISTILKFWNQKPLRYKLRWNVIFKYRSLYFERGKEGKIILVKKMITYLTNIIELWIFLFEWRVKVVNSCREKINLSLIYPLPKYSVNSDYLTIK